jgi:hypothetical protein
MYFITQGRSTKVFHYIEIINIVKPCQGRDLEAVHLQLASILAPSMSKEKSRSSIPGFMKNI